MRDLTRQDIENGTAALTKTRLPYLQSTEFQRSTRETIPDYVSGIDAGGAGLRFYSHELEAHAENWDEYPVFLSYFVSFSGGAIDVVLTATMRNNKDDRDSALDTATGPE